MPRQYGSSRADGWFAVLLAGALVVVACSGSDATEAERTAPATTPTPTSDEVFTSDVPDSAATTVPTVEDGPLAEVCPATVAIQTASLPGPAVGPLYALFGPDPIVDLATQRVSGPLMRVDGTIEDVVLEVRAGGPAVGFRDPVSLLAEDAGLLLAHASTAVALRNAAATPSVGVVALTDRSRDVLIVDPATHPGVDSVEALRDAAVEVRHVTDEPFIAFLESTGALATEQLVAGFDGEPAAFVQSDGAISQQGDLLVETVLLPALPQWGRAVTAIEASSAGWVVYDDALVARADDVGDLAECFGRLVPVVQEAIAAYIADPGPTNVLMAGARSQFAPLSRLTPELMDAGVAVGREADVFDDGADDTVGDFDVERLTPFLPDLADVLGVDAVDVGLLVTNEFIDPAVTSAG